MDAGTRANLGALLRTTSPAAADALLNIRHDPALFPAAVETSAIVPR